MPTQFNQLKHPVMLVHGLGARSSYGPVSYFYGMPELLKNTGNRYGIARLTPWHTIEHRATQLKEQIDLLFPDEEINLVGHSMGGLDARYLTSKLGMSDRISSVTTIGTPNRGTTMGDLAVGAVPGIAFKGAERMLRVFGSSPKAFHQLTRKYCTQEFAREAPNVPRVAYFSATSAITKPVRKSSLPIFWLSHKLLESTEGDNDGFVSVESAKWGDHIFTDTGDHYAQIGQLLGRARGMDFMSFYTRILHHLKKEGF